MDPQQDAQKGGAGKKKNKKNVNKNVPTDQQQKTDTIDVKNLQQQKSQEHSKPHQEQSTAGKDEHPQMSQSTSKKQSAKQKPEEKQNTPKDTKQPEPESGPKSKSKGKKDFPETSTQQKQSTKQKSEEKQDSQKKKKQPAPESSQKSKTKDDVKPSAKPVPSIVPEGNQQVEQKIQLLKSKLCVPKRRTPKSAGTAGRQTNMEVNHLPLNLDKLYKKTAYHMDVQFNPELPKRLLRTALEEFNRIHYPKVPIAFDGRRNMYTAKELKGRSGLVSVLNEENNKTIDFTIVTSVVNKVDMSRIEEYLKSGSSSNPPGEAFQALDIILKNRPFSLRFTNFGRSFFPVPRITPVDLGEGVELWKGFFQSPVMGWKPYLNIDVAHKGFPKHQPLTTYITEDMRCNLSQEMDRRSLNTLSSYVRGLKVDFLIPNQPNTKRSFKVVGLLDTAARYTFEMESPNKSKQNISVEKYFKVVRNYTVKYPNLPCLHVGNVEKKTAVPIELCTVQKGQLRMKKLTENQTASMVKNAARPPADRKHTIYNCIDDIKYNQDPVLKEFGIEVEEKFASVPARVLNQPSLAYSNKEIVPTAGVWKANRFARPVELKKWIVLNLCDRTNIGSIKNFEKELMNNGRGLNVAVSPMNPVYTFIPPRNCNMNEFQKQLSNIFEKLKTVVDLIVVIIPDYPPGLYATVKQSSELLTGVLTQCIKSRTMFKMNPSTSSNILLKINSKLNGVNHTLHARSSPKCMHESIIFGADVTHPSPDQTSIPSVAAVAASYDLYGSQYSMECRLQSPKVEIIQELENIVHLQLLKFKEKTKVIPKKIFYFRDGVSEGQFLQLLEYELIAIRRACMRLNVNYTPSITFLVVQKRHHTRIFPKCSVDMDGKFANVPSGTVIDTNITHPTELDFYLCSHASIQGTSRPTKYHVIWDDNNLTEDQVEELTFHLCFLFVRCTRSVSYPAPTYYAHLAAFRARAYIENKIINLNRLDEEQSKIKLVSSFVNNTPMFFI